MPSPEAVLTGLTTTANEWRSVAIVWHVLLAAFALGLLAGWRPSERLAAALLAAPFLTVSAGAWASDNPFNGTIFALLALVLIGAARRLPRGEVSFAPAPLVAAGASLVLYGSTYPHFLQTGTWTAYLYAAPFGLLPCPTLSVAIGFTLMLGLFRSRLWCWALVAAGIAYGAIGVWRLGVVLDYGLLAGAALLGIVAVTRALRRSPAPGANISRFAA